MSTDDGSERAVALLINEAASFYHQARFSEALRAAERAREGAQRLGSLRLEIKATLNNALALRALGEMPLSLTRVSWILAVAQDPARRAELGRAGVEYEVASAYGDWVEVARFLPEMEAEKLLAVLDAGEAYVRGIGKPGWRAGLLLQRAQVLANLRRLEAAIAAAEEGLSLDLRDGSGPGASLANHRWALGHLLRQANRPTEAARHYEAVLADETSSPYGRSVAHVGLARCARTAGAPADARRHAEEAVHLAEGMGDDNLQPTLEALLESCLAQKDLAAARAASDRQLEGARRLASGYRLYFALRNAARVALAEKDAARARSLLGEALPYAEALDRSRTGTVFRDEIARYRAQAEALASGTSE